LAKIGKSVKTVGFISIAIFLSKVLGMLRDSMFANIYGTSMVSDAYVSASRIPILFFDLTFGAAVIATFIPVFSGYLQKNEKKKAFEFANSFLNLVFIISGIFCVIGIVFSGWILKIMSPGLDVETAELARRLLVILLPSTIFTSIAYVFVGILQALDEFNIPALISLVSNVAVICYLMFFNQHYGIYGMATAMLIGWVLQVIIQIPSLIKKKYRYKPTLKIKNSDFFGVLKLAAPVLVSSWVQPICVAVNLHYASYLTRGAATAMNYANNLYIIIVGVFSFSITNYIFPQLSKLSAGGAKEEYSKVIKKSIRVMSVIILPVMVGLMVVATPIIQVIYARGEFVENSVAMTSTALFFYCFGMLALAFNEVLNKGFYAKQQGKTPMIASVLGMILNLGLSWVLTTRTNLGLGGLALSTAVSLNVICVILIVGMRKNIDKLIDKDFLIHFAKVLASAIVMLGMAVLVSRLTVSYGKYIQLVSTVAVGAIAYFVSTLLFKVDEIWFIARMLPFIKTEEK